MSPNSTTPLPVSQAAREAAAEFLNHPDLRDGVLAGRHDDNMFVQAFARFEHTLGEREPAPSTERELLRQLSKALAISIAETDPEIVREQLEQNKAALDTYLASTTREPALDLHTLEEPRQQGQREGKAAVLAWLRDMSAVKPSLRNAVIAAQLADDFEQSERPGCALVQKGEGA